MFGIVMTLLLQPIHASKRLRPSSSSSRIPSGTIAFHSIPKRTKPASSSAAHKFNRRSSLGSKSSKRTAVVFSSSSSDDDDVAHACAEELFAGAAWLTGEAAPSSIPSAAAAAVDSGTAAAVDVGGDGAAAVCSDDDTSGSGDIVLDGGLRVRPFNHSHFVL